MPRLAPLLILAGIAPFSTMAEPQNFDAFEASIPELQAAMISGEASAEGLVRHYLERIAAFDDAGPELNAMLYLNPRALDEARALDRERTERGSRGPLHGIPLVLKDNYDTQDMPTTAGALAMAGFIPSNDALQVRRLREAGAVFIGKTNLHEFARGIETVSSLGGQTRNPYDPRRNPGGSSGGTAAAVAAGFAAAGMGSDTCGSIRIPAAANNLFGLRVTQGLSSTDGIIPLSHTQDVAGPLARSMVDLAAMLDATVGPHERVPASFVALLNPAALEGARFGLLTDYLGTAAPYGDISKVVREAAAKMAEGGAEVVEITIDGLDDLLRSSSVIDYEFTTDVEAYLRASNAPVGSIPELLDSGQYHEALDGRYRRSVARANEADEYQARLERRKLIHDLLVETMATHDLDALVYPALRVRPAFVGEPQHGSLCRISAHSGLPAIALPAGFTADDLPVGMELLAEPFADGRLVSFGYAWEQLAKPRRPPQRTPSLAKPRGRVTQQ
jgi:Asp-tRNA(Asn)/Glu-tRNA(Gln) amidotransferase A subunit family amidase